VQGLAGLDAVSRLCLLFSDSPQCITPERLQRLSLCERTRETFLLQTLSFPQLEKGACCAKTKSIELPLSLHTSGLSNGGGEGSGTLAGAFVSSGGSAGGRVELC